SPTGPLHLGHAFSALTAWSRAQAAGGAFLLRIEDIDQTRARAHWETGIYEDLQWLGLTWETPVVRQSTRMEAYRTALECLWDQGLLYVCTCTRKDIEAALSAPQEGIPLLGPDGLIYPGTCRGTPRTGALPKGTALRLDSALALKHLNDLSFEETGPAFLGRHGIDPARFVAEVGDIVLARKEFGTSYHLSVVLDDAAQGITHVTRGEDLFEATQIHVVLQALLGLPTPIYQHHPLVRDEHGKRLAKRDDARALSTFRANGFTPDDIKEMSGLA
ncbi:MAG: tRNA glutamyl-Q(34) synthetase GluQRS, partial [Pseudomonadota bacterium]